MVQKIKGLFLVLVVSILITTNAFALEDRTKEVIPPSHNVPMVNKESQQIKEVNKPTVTTVVLELPPVLWTGEEKRVPYNEFVSMLKEGKLASILKSLGNDESYEYRVETKEGSRFISLGVLNSDILSEIEKNKVRIEFVDGFSSYTPVEPSWGAKVWMVVKGMLLSIVSYLPLLMLFIVLMLVLVYVQIKGAGLISRNKNQIVNPKDINVSFADIAGIDEAKRDVMEVVDFLKNKSRYNKLGAKVPKGVLLSGGPGNGKTMLAKAIAKESDSVFLQASGSEFIQMFQGLGAARVRDLFKKAKKSGRAIIFIDEIDSIGMIRGGLNNRESDQTLNQLLTEMDGFSNEGCELLVIAATNRAELLDEALLRPGRFDRCIVVNKPTQKGREDVLKVYIPKEFQDSIDIVGVSRRTVGFSGADLANLVNEALIIASKRNSEHLSDADIFIARDKILLGAQKKDMELLDAERRTTSVHESGHTIVALLMSNMPVEKVTIVPHANALGLMLQVPDREVYTYTKEELFGRIQVLMGGRAAEEVLLNTYTTGASNDMNRAYDLALKMVSSYGMGEVLGFAACDSISTLSASLVASLELEAIAMVNDQYGQAKKLLENHRSVLENLSEILFIKENLDKEEIKDITKGLWVNGLRMVDGKGVVPSSGDASEFELVENFHRNNEQMRLRKIVE